MEIRLEIGGWMATNDEPSRHSRILQPPPWWLFALAAAGDLGTATWRVISAGHNGDAALFFGSLIWPGLVIAAVVAAVAWLGWTLDLE
jgi:hypothetical protein